MEKEKEEWKLIPLSYHLGTVGIGPVFISSPQPSNDSDSDSTLSLYHDVMNQTGIKSTSESEETIQIVEEEKEKEGEEVTTISTTKPSDHDNTYKNNAKNSNAAANNTDNNDDEYGKYQNLHSKSTLTWEIVGTIKKFPKDFIVREIGGSGGSTSNNNSNNSKIKRAISTTSSRIAYLTDTTTLPPLQQQEQQQGHQKISDSDDHSSIIMKRKNRSQEIEDESNNVNNNNNNNNNSDSLSCNDSNKKVKIQHQNIQENKDNNNNVDGMVIDESSLVQVQKQQQIQQQNEVVTEERPIIKKVSTHFEVIQCILSDQIQTQTQTEVSTSTYLNDIQNLYKDALNDLKIDRNEEQDQQQTQQQESSLSSPPSSYVIIPPITDTKLIIHERDEGANNNKNGMKKEPLLPSRQRQQKYLNRGTLHRTLKVIFPLLSSCTLNNDDSRKEMNKMTMATNDTDSNVNDNANVNNNDNDSLPTSYKSGQYIKVMKDTTFHAIIPFLSHVHVDLVELYKFRNRGCCSISKKVRGGGGGDRSSSDRRQKGNKRKKRHTGITDSKDGRSTDDVEQSTINSNTNSNSKDEIITNEFPTQVFLRLKSGLPKESRRDIHHIIAKSCREFETGTDNDFKFDDEDGVTKTSSAITVQWSQRAQKKYTNTLQKKKKQRSNNENSTCNSSGGIGPRKKDGHCTLSTSSANTFCILKKTNQEHLATINHLVSILKCRPGDIGFAGMKDMRAVTYQFCTLRNISPHRARSANGRLRVKSIEIGNFDRVDWLLTTGMLEGNEFEIILRDMKRVEIRNDICSSGGSTNDGCLKERFVKCDSSHVNAMVNKIRNAGFVNFFGEQRVGNAGPSDEIGVRAFDIGRAMLKENFTKAIDLLMTGRHMSKGEYMEGPKMRKVRQVWKESHDPETTLKAFPQGNVLARERAVLQGLKRYGKDKPLDAWQCLPFSIRVFWIHAYQSYVWNMMATQRIQLGREALVGDLYVDFDQNDTIKVVTDPSAVTLAQIVLPLPGHNIQYPTNSIGKMYEDFLEKEGITFKKKVAAESTAKGAYRRLIVIPQTIEWQRVQEEEVINDDEDTVTAARFKFSLRSGSYATMFMRELMTSVLAR